MRSLLGSDLGVSALRHRRNWALLSALAVSAAAVWLALALSSAGGSAAAIGMGTARRPPDRLGIAPGKIKHVWLIIIENKSYDATFTGLNQNTYLWKTLPSQGVLLKDYYGTGHSSFDNYLSLVSGQAPQPDTQADCPFYKYFGGEVDHSGTLQTNPDYGQMVSAQGPYGQVGTNGCVYRPEVQTLFNQLDAAHISWKGYAQDLDAPNPSKPGEPPHSAGPDHCGAPYRAPALAGPTVKLQPNPGSATADNQYLPKHFPFPWFASLLYSGKDCNAAHIADLFDPGNGLYHDLQREATTPAFSWITPNMCSDGHDAVCAGNNLSGGWKNPNTPGPTPKNYTGGLYAVDLFLCHIVSEIERSPAFKDGGLIDITFDEAFPPFTYTHNSFYNSSRVLPNADTSIANDSAGETLAGMKSVKYENYEPPGPNTPLAVDASGKVTYWYPGPGNNSYIDRPANCMRQAYRPGKCLLGAGRHPPGETNQAATAPAGTSTVRDDAIFVIDRGRSVKDGKASCNAIPDGVFVGGVVNTHVMATAPEGKGGIVDTGSFTLVNRAGQPLKTQSALRCGITLGARSPSTDPLYDDQRATTGGGDTGSVLISPYITPGTTSTVFYNHYSWLRTMEDLFNVAKACSQPVCQGLDGEGHLGYAAQTGLGQCRCLGLVPFGSDVFNNPTGRPRPARSAPMPRALTASKDHPVLAIEGDTVTVALAHATALVTEIGPRVPRTTDAALASTVPCTFTVTITALASPVAITGTQFTAVDGSGAAHQLRVPGATARLNSWPVAAGHTRTLTMTADLPLGAGSVVWTPRGTSPVVTWDFDAEIN